MKCKIIFGEKSNISLNKNIFTATIELKDILTNKVFLEKKFNKFSKYSKNLHLFAKEGLLFGFASIKLNKDVNIKTKFIYDEILQSISNNELYRCWNYVPKINTIENGKEIYKKFNAGRKDAFNEYYGDNYESKLPAATGIGIEGENLVVMFIAGQKTPNNLENPNQCPVYKYPKKYGKKSPNFARATEIKNDFYFISGTASISGSSSKYKHNLEKQYDLMKENLNTMIKKVIVRDKNDSSAVVYYRNKKDLKFIKKNFGKDFSFSRKTIYLQSNICRKELLVEAEISFGFF